MDNVSVPAVPATPATPATPAADAGTNKPVLSDVKTINTPADKAAADKVVAKTPAEKEVIRKIKIGDQEYDEGVLASMIEKAKGADKKFLEAAKSRKEAMRFFKLAKENPREFLEKTGHDPKKFSYDEVAKDIQDKLRDPREVELEAAKKRLEAFEKKEAEEKKLRAQEKLTKEAKALEARFHSEIIEALEATPSIPKNGFSVAKIAKYIDTVRDKTGVLLSAKEVVSVIDQDIRSEVSGILKGATAEQIIELIGADGAEMIRQYHLAQLKNPLSGSSGAQGNGQEKPKAKRWGNSKDFWKTIDQAAKAERGE
jgi:hypothetical protein